MYLPSYLSSNFYHLHFRGVTKLRSRAVAELLLSTLEVALARALWARRYKGIRVLGSAGAKLIYFN